MSKYLDELTVIIRMLKKFFDDSEKIVTWIMTENPLLGGVSPHDMIQCGKFNKLCDFIETSLEENEI